MVAISEVILEDAPGEEAAEKLLEKRGPSEKVLTTASYPLWFSKRLLILILLFFGYLCAAVLRTNINMAIVAMTGNKTNANGNETTQKAADFNWNSATIGWVLSSHYYGFPCSAFAGYFSVKFGGSVTVGAALMIFSLLTILNPVFLDLNIYVFLAFRVLGGAFDGTAYAASAEVFSRWIPINERSTLMAIIFGGMYIGNAVAYPLCGYVAYYWGWRMIFYITGGICFIWSIIWLLVAKNQPSKDHRISREELSYILSKTETAARKDIVHPYRKIFTSSAVWALGVSKLSYSWGFSIIITTLPLYVKDVTQKKVNEIGVIASFPNILCIFMIPVIGASVDYLQNNHNLKPSHIHKSLMTFGFITSTILFAVASYSANFTLSMTCFILIKIFLAFNFLILQLICLYMAPKHSSVLLGISAVWYFIGQVSVPALVGFVVVNHSLAEWNTCFKLSAGILFLGTIIYVVYGSSELQSWATTSKADDTKYEKPIKRNDEI